jgi:DNA-binding transcriptional ArsR family regulator
MSALQRSSELSSLFQALADPARRGMIERLCRGPASVSELAQPLDMTLSAVVQHLRILETSGLVRSRKSGRVRTCQLDQSALQNAEHWLAARRSSWERRLDSLGDFLAEQAQPKRQR